jgi:hypothetical protein
MENQNNKMETPNDYITDTDLSNNRNKYDIAILEKNMNHLNHKIILCTQHLDVNFCAKLYIMNYEDIDSGSEDYYIWDVPYILYFQKHIDKYELCRKIDELEEEEELELEKHIVNSISEKSS